jgi:glycosyltransferase involved in cell wall biosynthesis
MSIALPKITIVTPSFNHRRFIEQTITSVLDQEYPGLEYIVMDGGSTDGTLDILRKYEHHFQFWVSAPDHGQADAINKGFARASGDILAWLNSDDFYEPGVFAQAGELFHELHDVDVISGRCRLYYGDARNRVMNPSPLRTLEDFLRINSNWRNGHLIVQPEAFFRRRAFDKAGGLREELHFCFDQRLWADMAKSGCKFDSVDRHWANLRMHAGQKTSDLTGAHAELARVAWSQLRENWDLLHDPLAIADDIFCALDGILQKERRLSDGLSKSTSYRIGRFLTKGRFWC